MLLGVADDAVVVTEGDALDRENDAKETVDGDTLAIVGVGNDGEKLEAVTSGMAVEVTHREEVRTILPENPPLMP